MSDERLERIENKIDKIVEIQADMKVDLALHIEGVRQTRELIALKEKAAEEALKANEAKIQPVIQHVQKVEGWISVGKAIAFGVGKFCVIILGASALMEGIAAVFEMLHK